MTGDSELGERERERERERDRERGVYMVWGLAKIFGELAVLF